MALGTPYTVLATANAGGSLTSVCAVTQATVAGDALIVAAAINSGLVNGVTDSKGNTYVLPAGASNTAQSARVYAFVALNTTALTTSDTITVTYNVSTSTGDSIIVRGISGVAATSAVDISINAASTSTSPAIGPSAALAQASEYAVALIANGNGGGVPSSWTGGFTDRADQVGGTGPHLALADLLTSSTAALSAGATIISTNWCMVLLTVQPAAQAAVPLLAYRGGQAYHHKTRVKQQQAFSGFLPALLNINAVAPEATGTAAQPVVEIDLPQTTVVATGSAPQAIANVRVLAGIPTATGGASAPALEIDVKPSVPTATGSDAAVPSLTVFAGIPTANGTVVAPSILTGLTVNAGIPTATGTASQPVVAESVFAGIPAAAGSAAGVANIQSKPGIPAAIGAASQPVVAEAVNAGIPVVTATSPQPGIVTGLVVNAPAVTATGSAAAVANIQPLAGTATGTGVSPQPIAAPSMLAGAPTVTGSAAAVANVRPLAGAPTATGSAGQAVVSPAVIAGAVVATGAVAAPSITTGLVINVPAAFASGVAAQPLVAEAVLASVAVATGTAPTISRGVLAGIPTASGVATAAAVAEAVNALIATATGVAGNAQVFSVLPHVTGRATGSVTKKVTFTFGVTDPRDAKASVSGKTSSSSAVATRSGSSSVTETSGSVGSVT